MSLVTRWAFKNKSAVGLLIVMALVMGILSYFKLPMELMPPADNPQVTITAIGPGFDARSMETSVTTPLENALSAVKGKKDMFSTSGDGYSKIDIFYESKTNMKDAKAEAQEAVNMVQLPQGVMKPFVLQLNTSMIPVSQLSIAFKDGLTEKKLEDAQKYVVNELQKIKGVASVALAGKTSPNISVTVDPLKLAKSGVPVQTLMGILQGRNVSASIGEKTIDGTTGNLKVVSSIDSLDTLKNLPLAPGVALKDVATVEMKTAAESVSRLGGRDVLFAIVNKETSANAVSVGKLIQKTADRINKENKNVTLSVFYSSSDMVVTSVNSMMREVLMGALFATIVILLFLRNFRATLITIVSIPLSLAITLLLLDLSGVTLNIITLGAVAVAVGRLVDDSIVVIENIYRRLQNEKFSIDMILSATKEVAHAITSSTITTVAVFLPMGLLRGALQAFLLPFALTVTYSLLTSLIVALTVVPLLSSRLLRNSEMKEHKAPKRFIKFLEWNLRYKAVPLLLAVILFAGSIVTYIMMPKGAIDSSDSSFVSVQLSYPSDTPVKKVLEEGKKLEQYLLEQPEAKYVLLQNGNSSDAAKWGSVVSPTLVNISIVMNKNANAETFMEHVRQQKESFKDAAITVGSLNLMSNSSTNVTVDIVGDDMDAINKLASEVTDKIKAVKNVEKVSSNQEETKPVYNVKVNPAVANAQEIAMQLKGMMNPIPIGTITLDKNTSQVILEPMVNPSKMDELSSMIIGTAEGPKKLSEIAKIEKVNEPSSLYHLEGKPYVRITAQAEASKLSVVGNDIKKATKDLSVPDGIEVLVGGASVDQSDDMSDMMMIMLISIGLVYLIMVLTFKTLRAPFAIIMSLPLAAIGAVLGLIVSGVSPDYTAIFGALMLVGIVVTNAIVLIDRVKHNEERMTIRDALLEAAATRMRPILMTATATICAMMPLLFGKTEMGSIVSKSLAIVVVGGLAMATLLTLVIVPAVYELLYFHKSGKQRKLKAELAAQATTAAQSE